MSDHKIISQEAAVAFKSELPVEFGPCGVTMSAVRHYPRLCPCLFRSATNYGEMEKEREEGEEGRRLPARMNDINDI